MLRKALLSFALIAAGTGSAPALLIPDEPRPGDAATTSSAPVPPEALAEYEKGLAALGAGNLRAAEAAFRASNQRIGPWPLPLLGLAETALRRGDTAQARDWLDQARRAAPQSSQVLHALGRYHHGAGELEAARVSLEQAIRAQPNNIGARLDLADVYARQPSTLGKAIPAYRAVIQRSPEHAGAHHGLGMALMATGSQKAAEEALLRAIELKADNVLSRQALGQLYLRQGRNEAAHALFAAVLASNPGFLPALAGRGDALLGAGRFRDAAVSYEAVLDKRPNDAATRVKLGMTHQALGQTSEALSAYHMAVRLDDSLAVAYNNLAWLTVQTNGNLSDALSWARRAVRLEPRAAAFHDTLGWVHHARGELELAERTLEGATRLSPPSADVFYHLGRVRLAQGRGGEAREAFEQAIAVGGSHAPAARALQQHPSASGPDRRTP